VTFARGPRLAGSAALVGALLWPRLADAQACCAGTSAITPGRLDLHERALVGAQLRAAWLLGSYDTAGAFRDPAGSAELDLEQDVFGSLRLLDRGQAGVLLPVLESWRRSPTTGAEFGGGVGDVNFNLRYDLTWGREFQYLPGIAALVGVTLPSGRPPESARQPLASDATGIGTTQMSAGLALERPLGDFLLNVTGLAAKRASRHVQGLTSELGTQFTCLLAVGYTVFDHTSAAAVLTYAFEGNARVNGTTVPGSARRQLRVAFALSRSFSDTLRLQGSLFMDPPVSGLGQGQSATVGTSFSVVRSFL
jgi:hypothetical protein